MDVNYELYKVFYYVASTLSFSEAASQLFISQSAVSQSIKTLEKKLNQTLFIRSTKKVQLTPEGEILLRHIEPAVHLIGRGEAQLMDTSAGGGQLRIGASDTICRYFLVPYLEKIPQSIPGSSYQGNQRYLYQMRGIIRKRTGRSDCCKLPKCISWQFVFCKHNQIFS